MSSSGHEGLDAEIRKLTPAEVLTAARRYKGTVTQQFQGVAWLLFPTPHHATSWAATLFIEGQCDLFAPDQSAIPLAGPVTVYYQFGEA